MAEPPKKPTYVNRMLGSDGRLLESSAPSSPDENQNLAEMAHRLENALRRPTDAKPPDDELGEGLRAIQELASKRTESAKDIAAAVEPVADSAARAARTSEILGQSGLRHPADLGTELHIAAAERRRQEREDREDRRQAVATAIDQSERRSTNQVPSESATSSTQSAPPNSHGSSSFSAGELIVLISCALFAEPFCHAAADAFLHEHYDKALLGFAIGLPPGLAGGSYHWWKRYLSVAARKAVIPTALVLGTIGIVLAFAYVAGPEMYRRAMTPSAGSAAPAAPSSPTQVSPHRYYSVAEKEELADRIAKISVMLNKDLPELAEQWRHTSGAVLQNFSSKAGIDVFFQQTEALEQKTIETNKRMWIEAVNGNPDFSPDLRRMIGGDNGPLSRLLSAIGQYKDSVRVLGLLYGRVNEETIAQYVQLLRPIQIELLNAANALARWGEESNPKIAAMRKAL